MHKTLLALVAFFVSVSAAFAAPQETERAFRYELRALGANAGEATLLIGKTEKVGGQSLRPITINGGTAGLAANILSADTKTTTWVDHHWQPWRTRSDQVINREPRTIKLRYAGRTISGTDERGGKLFKNIDVTADKKPLDLVSIFGWIMHQDLSPGTKYRIPVFDSRRLYQVDIKVGVAKEIQVPMGGRRAIPVSVTVSRGEYKRDMELFISADKERAPLKLIFKYGLIGTVEASLVATTAR